ncbi:class I SAM-dependent methyltransferase [Taibaiella koreensis]|uniref:class I SAM-dependent methyltransferase n=1 Tax=Taibaiella koreensis TaxID=1268548 RepID=UPI000E5A0E3D|nr:class I SAM-dependent methyltransferase [Taibaiella koreensis]
MEKFQPIANTAPTTFVGKVKFYFRMVLDLQILTIYSAMKKELPRFEGKVLDVGCGDSPYYHLLHKDKTNYYGIDVAIADDFKYSNEKITIFDGKHIPFNDGFFDAFLCTEVLEHCFEFQALIDDMYRVSRKGAKGIITIPWSARYHYIPYDYFRYTPSTLKKIFTSFGKVEVYGRGTDLTAICAKIIVLFFRNFTTPRYFWTIPFLLVLFPCFIFAVLLGHLSLLLNLGSGEDPLGYTIIVEK